MLPITQFLRYVPHILVSVAEGKAHLSSYMFKILNGPSPSNFIKNSNLFLEEVGMGLTVIFIHLNPKTSFFYYLGAKAWNCLPTDLRNLK